MTAAVKQALVALDRGPREPPSPPTVLYCDGEHGVLLYVLHVSYTR